MTSVRRRNDVNRTRTYPRPPKSSHTELTPAQRGAPSRGVSTARDGGRNEGPAAAGTQCIRGRLGHSPEPFAGASRRCRAQVSACPWNTRARHQRPAPSLSSRPAACEAICAGEVVSGEWRDWGRRPFIRMETPPVPRGRRSTSPSHHSRSHLCASFPQARSAQAGNQRQTPTVENGVGFPLCAALGGNDGVGLAGMTAMVTCGRRRRRRRLRQ
jgi:hypothetical protein